MTTISSRNFNQDTSGAKKAAANGPVFITDRGQPSHVLLTMKDYQKLAGKRPSIVELLSLPGSEDIPFEPPRVAIKVRPADFS